MVELKGGEGGDGRVVVGLSVCFGPMSDALPENAGELNDYVQKMLDGMQGRFTSVTDNVVRKVDDMQGRLDELERSVNELIEASGVGSLEDDEGDRKAGGGEGSPPKA